MTNAVSGLEMSMHHSGISFALTVAHGWTERTVTAMVKIAMEIFLCIGTAIVYILSLIIATMISVKILGMKDADDIDYVMTANVIQFFVMVMVIAERVVQWMT